MWKTGEHDSEVAVLDGDLGGVGQIWRAISMVTWEIWQASYTAMCKRMGSGLGGRGGEGGVVDSFGEGRGDKGGFQNDYRNALHDKV